MSAKDSIAIKTCELSKEEFNNFLALYPIPLTYHVILLKSNETVFDTLSGCRNFIYAEDEEDLYFLPKEASLPAEVTAYSRGSPKPELFIVHPGSVAARIKDRKCKTRRWSSMPLVKRKLAFRSSNSRATRAKTFTLKDNVPFWTVSNDDEGLFDVSELNNATASHFKIFAITPPAWKNHLDNHMDVELLDLHDRCYARQTVVDNDVNKISCEFLDVIAKLRGECDNPTVIALREKISTLSTKVKEHKANLDRMMLESQTWASYQASLSTLESHIASLEAEKAWLEAVEVSFRKEVNDVKRDRMEVVSKVVPYAVMEIIHNDDLGSVVGRLVSSAIFNGRPIPSKNQAPIASSQKATPSFIPASNPMSPHADASIVKPQSF
nr:hypothetical protein [Tanacetum cinerariifolium]